MLKSKVKRDLEQQFVFGLGFYPPKSSSYYILNKDQNKAFSNPGFEIKHFIWVLLIEK